MAEEKLVKVACHVPNGLMINLFKEGNDDGTGRVRDGAGYRLSGPSPMSTGAGNTARLDLPAGHTEIPEPWFREWLDQNKMSALVTMKQVYAVEPEETKGENPTS